MVHSLGKEAYGSWTIIVSITGQLIALDFGIRSAIVRFLAMNRSADSAQLRSSILSSASFLLSLSGVVGFGVLLAISIYWRDWFQVSETYYRAMQIAFILMSLDAATELVFGIFDGALASSERYDVLNVLNCTRQLLTAIFIVCALESGLGVVGIAAVTLGVRLAQRILKGWLTFKLVPHLRLRTSAVTSSALKQVGTYGLWTAIGLTAVRVIYQIDVLIVGIFFSATVVAIYAIPVLLIEHVRTLSQATATVLTPRLSSLISANDSETSMLLLLKWASLGQLLAIVIGMPLFVTGEDFIVLWMGADFQIGGSILHILTIPFFFTFPSIGIVSYLYAANQHALYAKITFGEALLNLVLSILLVSHMGLIGVAVGTLVPSIIFRGILLPLRSRTIVGLELIDYFRVGFIRCLPVALFHFCTLYGLDLLIGASNWLTFFVSNLIGVFIFIFIVYQFYLEDEEKQYLLRRISLK